MKVVFMPTHKKWNIQLCAWNEKHQKQYWGVARNQSIYIYKLDIAPSTYTVCIILYYTL